MKQDILKDNEYKNQSFNFLAPDWLPYLAEEFNKDYVKNIFNFLHQETIFGYNFFPPENKIFRALELLSFNDVRVVILGQDPYHGTGQANGLSFAVEDGIKTPPSLLNIFKEIESDLKISRPHKSNLENWAKQGVLLLNTVLTVRKNSAYSHRKKGWEKFTDHIISSLNKKNSPVVFLLWGASAQAKSFMITNEKHLILKAPHPSPLSAHRGFLGCKHFSQVNNFLSKQNLPKIDWDI